MAWQARRLMEVGVPPPGNQHPTNIQSQNAKLQTPEVRIERIVSQGHKSPEGFWYDQPEHEWVLVLKGAARLEFEDRGVWMGPGDYINIPAHT